MVKTLVGTPDPKVSRVRWFLVDDWTYEDKYWTALVAKAAIKDFVGTLQLVGATEIEVDGVS